MRARLARYAAVALAAGVLLSGCGGSDQEASSGSAPDREVAGPAEQAAPKAEADQGVPEAQRGATAKLPDRAATERSLVRIGQLTVRAKDVSRAAAAATRIAAANQGEVSGDERKSDGGRSWASLTIRVPGDRFTDTVDKLGALGKELTREVRTEDVTDDVVDLDTRIRSQQASVDRTRALFARAQRIEDIVSIERQLAEREAELASLQARARRLGGQVEYSTITLELVAPDAVVRAPEKERTGFLAGLSSGWSAFLTVGNGLLTAFGAMLPFLLAIAIPVFALVVLIRRLTRPKTAGPAPSTSDE